MIKWENSYKKGTEKNMNDVFKGGFEKLELCKMRFLFVCWGTVWYFIMKNINNNIYTIKYQDKTY